MMSVVHTFKLYELLNKYFKNDEDSKAFVSEMDSFMSVKLNSDTHELATKSDVRVVRTEIEELKKDVSIIRKDVAHLEIKMEAGFKDVLKWIITLMVAFAALIITCTKLLS
jgi:hypothetical protein